MAIDASQMGGMTSSAANFDTAGLTPDSAVAQTEQAFAMGEAQMHQIKMMTLMHDMIMEALRAIKF